MCVDKGPHPGGVVRADRRAKRYTRTAFASRRRERRQITSLEREVHELADANDTLEQYTRQPNLRFEGILEADHGEDTDAKVLEIANSKLGMTPPLQLDDLERSHRLGRPPADTHEA